MAKAKFTLSASPTFKAPVAIQVPGGKPVQVEFVFKHRTRDDFKEFIEALEGRDDIDMLLEIASGWELDDAFDAKSLALMTQNYMGSARAVLETYISELTSARVKN